MSIVNPNNRGQKMLLESSEMFDKWDQEGNDLK